MSTRGLEDRNLSMQLVGRRTLFRDLLVQRRDDPPMIDDRIARLVTAELEAEIGAGEQQRAGNSIR